jgi:hypothetical protein
MKYKVFSKVLSDSREVDFEGLKKIGNAYEIKGEIDSKKAIYENGLYVICRANENPDRLKILLANTEGYKGNENKMLSKNTFDNGKVRKKSFGY